MIRTRLSDNFERVITSESLFYLAVSAPHVCDNTILEKLFYSLGVTHPGGYYPHQGEDNFTLRESSLGVTLSCRDGDLSFETSYPNIKSQLPVDILNRSYHNIKRPTWPSSRHLYISLDLFSTLDWTLIN